MADGTKYTDKTSLIDAIKGFIFGNSEKKITGDNHQTAMLDVVESMFDKATTDGINGVTRIGDDLSLGGPLIQDTSIIANDGTARQFSITEASRFDFTTDSAAALTTNVSFQQGLNTISAAGIGNTVGFSVSVNGASFTANDGVESSSISSTPDGVVALNGSSALQFTSNLQTLNFNDGAGNDIILTDGQNSKGIEYGANYSANFTARSLVDKEYVDNVLEGATVFTAVDTGANLTLKRYVNGPYVKIIGTITNDAVQASKKCLINNLIPQDFNGNKWFKITKVTTIHNASVGTGGSCGYLELDEVSSYTNGAAVADKTILHLAGDKIGEGRSYGIDSFNQSLGPTGGLVDREENDTNSSNYMTSSPKDLSLSAFNLAYITSERAVIDYANGAGVSAMDIDITFMIEGELF